MKKLLVLVISAMLLLSLSASALAAQNDISIVIDNQNCLLYTSYAHCNLHGLWKADM